MIKLILSDLDGTFLDENGTFNYSRFELLLSKLTARNIAFAAVTGKQTQRVQELFGALAPKIWILGDSASRITFDNEIKFQSLIPNQLGLMLIQEILSIHSDLSVIACYSQAAFILESRDLIDGKLIRQSYASLAKVENFEALTDDFVKITIFDRQKRCYEIFNQLKTYQDKFYIVASEAAWIDVTLKGINKGTTVQKLQELLSVTKEETMAFGDGYNDFELLAQASFSYAMENAFVALKEKAKFIAPSNLESGVFQVIENEILK